MLDPKDTHHQNEAAEGEDPILTTLRRLETSITGIREDMKTDRENNKKDAAAIQKSL